MKRFVVLFALFAVACGKSPEKGADPVVIIGNNTTTQTTNGVPNNTTAQTNNAPNNTPNNTPAMTFDEFTQSYREVFCGALFECPNAATLGFLRTYGRHGSAAECAAARDVAYGPRYDVAASLESGAIAYAPEHAQQCLDDVREAFCEGTWGRGGMWGIPACVEALRGTVAPNGACATPYDCAEGYCSLNDACGERRCTVSMQPCGDGTCTLDAQYCDAGAGACRARRARGQSCDFGQCELGNYCDATQAGTCVAVGSSPEGASCVVEYSCQPGLVCDANRCTAPVFGAAGAACTLFGARWCEPGLVCQLGAGETEGTCGAPLGAGSSCAADYVCVADTMCDVWGDSVCTPYFADGATCQSPAQCESGSCPGGMGTSADGICAPAC